MTGPHRPKVPATIATPADAASLPMARDASAESKRRPCLPIIRFPSGRNPGAKGALNRRWSARIAASWIPLRRLPELPVQFGRPAKTTIPVHNVNNGNRRFRCVLPGATALPPRTGNIMQNMQKVASDNRLCTLRLRQNYGLRNLGIPLRRTAPEERGPPGSPYRERALICQRSAPVRPGHDRFRRRSNDDDAGA
jgi:hypothetical protein